MCAALAIRRPAAGGPLPEVTLRGSGPSIDHAARMLRDLSVPHAIAPGPADPHPALELARCGALDLAGPADAAPIPSPGRLAAAMRGAWQALSGLAARSGAESAAGLATVDPAALLGERAAIAGLHRRGAVSPGGGCRLLRAADGWIALSLPRADDVALLPAWLETPEAPGADAWEFARRRVRSRERAPLVERAQWMGLPVAATASAASDASPSEWVRVEAHGPGRVPAPGERPFVVDLSALWAGPLCGHLLAASGAEVVKVESLSRPDGARRGPPAFFDLLNAGKPSVALDFECAAGRRALCALIESADVVIDAARPRALAQLGVDAMAWVRARPGRTWVALTGYGRRGAAADRVAFGDDAAVAAGWTVAGPDGPCFAGDALADPLTGVHAAAATLASWQEGGGRLLDVSLWSVARTARALGPDVPIARIEATPTGGWRVRADGVTEPVRPPRARRCSGRARALGSDTARVLTARGIAC